MSNEIQVKIAEFKVAKSPDKLITLGLGSCIGITFYEPIKKIGGMAHIMLPDSRQFSKVSNVAKFADLAIPAMLEEMLNLGANKFSIKAKIAGGAQMFSAIKNNSTLDVGRKNIEAVKNKLQAIGIKIVAEEVGGQKGRTMIFDTSNGEVIIRTLGSQKQVI